MGGKGGAKKNQSLISKNKAHKAAATVATQAKTAPKLRVRSAKGSEPEAAPSDAEHPELAKASAKKAAAAAAKAAKSAAAAAAPHESDYSDDDAEATSLRPMAVDAGTAAAAKAELAEARSKTTPTPKGAGVVYLGHIPHGFYEEQMKGFFGQFGTVSRLRLARNKKTGRSKHHAWIEFKHADVAVVVAKAMNGYLMFSKVLQCQLLAPDKVHPETFKGANRAFRPVDRVAVMRKRTNKVRTPEEAAAREKRLLGAEGKKRKKLAALGIDYDFGGFAADAASGRKRQRGVLTGDALVAHGTAAEEKASAKAAAKAEEARGAQEAAAAKANAKANAKGAKRPKAAEPAAAEVPAAKKAKAEKAKPAAGGKAAAKAAADAAKAMTDAAAAALEKKAKRSEAAAAKAKAEPNGKAAAAKAEPNGKAAAAKAEPKAAAAKAAPKAAVAKAEPKKKAAKK